MAGSFCIITWESSDIAWVHLEIFKKIILFEKWNKVENAKIAKFNAFFWYLPIEITVENKTPRNTVSQINYQ